MDGLPQEAFGLDLVPVERILNPMLQGFAVAQDLAREAAGFNLRLAEFKAGRGTATNLFVQHRVWKQVVKRADSITYLCKNSEERRLKLAELKEYVLRNIQSARRNVFSADHRVRPSREPEDPRAGRTQHHDIPPPADRLKAFSRRQFGFIRESKGALDKVLPEEPPQTERKRVESESPGTATATAATSRSNLLTQVLAPGAIQQQIEQIIQNDGQGEQQPGEKAEPRKRFMVPKHKPYTQDNKLQIVKEAFSKGNYAYSVMNKAEQALNVDLNRLKMEQLQHQSKVSSKYYERTLVNWARAKSKSQSQISRKLSQKQALAPFLDRPLHNQPTKSELAELEQKKAELKLKSKEPQSLGLKRAQALNKYGREKQVIQKARPIKIADFLLVNHDQIKKAGTPIEEYPQTDRQPKQMSRTAANWKREQQTARSVSTGRLDHVPAVVQGQTLDKYDHLTHQRNQITKINRERVRTAKREHYGIIDYDSNRGEEPEADLNAQSLRATSLSFFTRREASREGLRPTTSSEAKRGFNNEQDELISKVKDVLTKRGVNITYGNVFKSLTVPEEGAINQNRIYKGHQALLHNPYAKFPEPSKKKKKKK